MMLKSTNILATSRVFLFSKFSGILLILFSFTCSPLLSQNDGARSISGTVTDATGNSIPGVNVLVKGKNRGTVTDFDGSYGLEVLPEDSVLVFSYIGYLTEEREITGSSVINAQLSEEAVQLSSVVVTGYSTEKKKDLTGAVAVIETADITNQPIASVDQMLQGRAPGVNVVNDYAPGGGVAVRIRGYSTIGNNEPLYIIDGVPVTSGLNFLNPNDIESIQVLKDASSASIYGSRAANGVVIITTKKGSQVDKPTVGIDAYVGVQEAFNLPDMLSAQEYGDLLFEAIRNDGGTPASDVYGDGPNAVIPAFLDDEQTIPSDDVDWVEELFEPAVVQSYYLNFAKSTKNANQLLSVGYFNQEGILQYTDFERVTARINTDYKLFDRLTIGQNLSVSHTWGRNVTNNSALGGSIYAAYKFPSITPVYDLNGVFAGNPLNDQSNPLGNLFRNKDNVNRNLRIFGNVYADLEIVKNLSVRTSFGLTHNNFNLNDFSPRYQEINTQNLVNSLTSRSNTDFDWVWTNTVQYNLNLDEKHNFTVLGGLEAIETLRERLSGSRSDFAFEDENFRFLDAGDGSNQLNSGARITSSLFSVFGKLGYDFDNRYLVSFLFRRDGSSKLGEDKYGNFPAFSLGWRLSEEQFFPSDGFIDDLKVRFGWGQNGNQEVPAFSTLESYASNPYYSNYAIDGEQNSVETGFTQTRNANPSLKWETTTQTNFGLDFSLFNYQIEVSADYFVKKTEDLLVQRPLPPLVGGTNQIVWDNVGEMENKGFEFLVNYRNRPSADLQYSVGLNMSFIDNNLTALDEDIDFITIPSSTLHVVNFDQEVSRTDVGQPIASFYGHEVLGIFQSDAEVQSHAEQPNAQPGDLKFRDVNGDGVIDADDRTFIGSPHPDFTLGINLSAGYKGFDATAFLQGSFGNDLYDLTRYYGDFYNLSAYNKQARVNDAWRPDNTGASVPRLSLNDPNNNIRPSSYYVFDGSYLRLKTFQIGYTLSNKVLNTLGSSQFRKYLHAQNLFTITDYDGLDPEVGLQNYSSSNRNLDIGVDRAIYPPSRTFTFGVQAKF